MKTIITSAVLVTILFTVIGANAQRWGRGYERHDDNRYSDRREEHHEGDRNRYYGHEERRDYEAYYHQERRECYHEPRIVCRENLYTPKRVSYYYFPYTNVYYNPYNRLYSFPFRGEWVSDYNLPQGLVLNEPYREVYCNDNENIWAYNRAHIESFRVQIGGPRFSVGIRF